MNWQVRRRREANLLALATVRSQVESWSPSIVYFRTQRNKFYSRIRAMEANVASHKPVAPWQSLRLEFMESVDRERGIVVEVRSLGSEVCDILAGSGSTVQVSFREQVFAKRRQFDQSVRRITDSVSSKKLFEALEDCRTYHRELHQLSIRPAECARRMSICQDLMLRIETSAIEPGAGAHEENRGIRRTLAKARAEAERGNFERAIASMNELQPRQEAYVRRFEERTRSVLEEIAWWQRHPLYGPLLTDFRVGPAGLSSAELDRWYAIRDEIRATVDVRAETVRVANTPSGGTERKKLSMKLEESTSPRTMEDFARAAWARCRKSRT